MACARAMAAPGARVQHGAASSAWSSVSTPDRARDRWGRERGWSCGRRAHETTEARRASAPGVGEHQGPFAALRPVEPGCVPSTESPVSGQLDPERCPQPQELLGGWSFRVAAGLLCAEFDRGHPDDQVAESVRRVGTQGGQRLPLQLLIDGDPPEPVDAPPLRRHPCRSRFFRHCASPFCVGWPLRAGC